MIHVGGEMLGEISVAEDGKPLGPEADEALEHAARLAAPFMLRHRLVVDTERMGRWRLLRALLDGDDPAGLHAEQFGFEEGGSFTVAGLVVEDQRTPRSVATDMFRERTLHLLSLHARRVDPRANLMFSHGVYYAVVPIATAAPAGRLVSTLKPVLQQLARAGVERKIAVGPRVAGLGGIPRSRAVVDDLLHLLRRQGQSRTMASAEDLWAELVLLQVERAVGEEDIDPLSSVAELARPRHGTPN